MARILVVNDDPKMGNFIKEILKYYEHEIRTVSDGVSGLQELEKNYFDLVLTDFQMPRMNGIQILEEVVNKFPETLTIILTGYGTIKDSVEAVKKGAFDYIPKPICIDELLSVVEKALKFKSLKQENIQLKRELKEKYHHKNIIGTSQAIKEIYDLIDKVADTNGSILINGPSGTGKELIARAIHYNSSRGDKPMIAVNCGAIPEQLLESELFGHEKGAFPGAHKTHIGRLERAYGGTFFFDEISGMNQNLQVKLLRVLKEQKFERLGGTKTIHVNIRIISATNRDIVAAIREGSLREDLYNWLSVISINIPPLKERKSDIPLLIGHFLKKLQKNRVTKVSGFSEEAIQIICDYDWPGNVRELENFINRLLILCDRPIIDIDDLPEYF